jgi:hypothetical protein
MIMQMNTKTYIMQMNNKTRATGTKMITVYNLKNAGVDEQEDDYEPEHENDEHDNDTQLHGNAGVDIESETT